MSDSANNLDQIRDLLFGQQLDVYENQFQLYGDRLEQVEASLNEFNDQVKGQLQQLETTISDELLNLNQSLEGKLKSFNAATNEELAKLDINITGEMDSFTQELNSFQREFGSQYGGMKEDLEEIRQHLDQQLQELKEAIAQEWNSNFSETDEGKLTKDQLGKMLFEFSLKTRDGNLLPELPANVNDQIKAELEQ